MISKHVKNRKLVTSSCVQMQFSKNKCKSQFSFDFTTYWPTPDVTTSLLTVMTTVHCILQVAALQPKAQLNRQSPPLWRTSCVAADSRSAERSYLRNIAFDISWMHMTTLYGHKNYSDICFSWQCHTVRCTLHTVVSAFRGTSNWWNFSIFGTVLFEQFSNSLILLENKNLK